MRHADLKYADLIGVRFAPGKTKLAWSSHWLLSEILWRAAKGHTEREMMAAWISKKPEWCWERLATFDHPQREWVLTELRKWVVEDDDAPELLKI